MSVECAEQAIESAKSKIEEWEGVGLPGWREDQTRYGIIDPIIRALGWDTGDPKECHPEYPRVNYQERVDYALFRRLDMDKLRESDMPAPDIIIEAKALDESLEWALDKLRRYVKSPPSMNGGIAVLTDGVKWRLYEVGSRGGLGPPHVVNINEDHGKAAKTLHDKLGRHRPR